MSKKRYYGYKKRNEHYSIRFRDDVEKGKMDMGTLIAMEYENGLFQLIKINWGEKWIMNVPVMVSLRCIGFLT